MVMTMVRTMVMTMMVVRTMSVNTTMKHTANRKARPRQADRQASRAGGGAQRPGGTVEQQHSSSAVGVMRTESVPLRQLQSLPASLTARPDRRRHRQRCQHRRRRVE